MESFDPGRWNESTGTRAAAQDLGRPNADGDGAVWAEFAQASTAEAFCRSWLALQCRIIGGVSGGVVLWGTPDRGPFAPIAVWPQARRNFTHLTEAAQRALRERQGLLLKHEPNGDRDAAHRERYDIAYPIEVSGRLYGVVVLDVAPRPDPQLQGILRQLQWGFAWLEVLVRREDVLKDGGVEQSQPKARLQLVLDLVATAFGHERFYAAATSFVTGLSTRLACDRVSVGFVRGGRTRVRAVSHSAQFGKQTNLIRAIEGAMDEALDQQKVIAYPPPPGPASPITRAHAELARQQGAGAICSIPLNDGHRIIGVLTLERPPDQPFDAQTVELCEAAAAVVGPMLEVQRRDDRWLIAKVADSCWTWLSQLIGPRHVALKLAIFGLVGMIAFFAIVQGDYRVSATTSLEPQVRRAAVAPFNGYIADTYVRAGDRVREGQVLCTLDDRELRLERLKRLGQHEQVLKQYHQAMAARNAAQVMILSAQLDQVRAELALLDDQLTRIQIIAPFDGIVATGDLSQALGAPVERGQVLFEVAPLDAYRVILQVDERDIADVAVGHHGHLVLSAFPTEHLPFVVEQITPVSTAREGRNYFRVEARLQTLPERLRPGMEGIGKIDIDRRLLIWIWTHQLVDWLRLALWSWLP